MTQLLSKLGPSRLTITFCECLHTTLGNLKLNSTIVRQCKANYQKQQQQQQQQILQITNSFSYNKELNSCSL